MSGYTFSISETFSYAFSVFKENFHVLLPASIALVVVSLLKGGLDYTIPPDMAALGLALNLIAIISIVYSFMGILKTCFAIYDNQLENRWLVEIFRQRRYYVFILVSVVSFILYLAVMIVLRGMVLWAAAAQQNIMLFPIFFLIGSMIYASVRLQFAPLLIVDRDMSSTQALSLSWKATKGRVLLLLLFQIVLVLVLTTPEAITVFVQPGKHPLAFVALGWGAYIVSMVVIWPIALLAWTSSYRQLIEFYEATQGDQVEQAF